MSRKNKNNDKTEKMNTRPSGEPRSPIFYEVAILVTVLICVLLFLSNFGWIGPVGEFLSRIMFGLFGLLAFILPLILLPLFVYGFFLGRLRSKSVKNVLNTPSERRKRKIKLALIIVVLISICVLTELIVNSYEPGVGLLSYYHSAVDSRSGGGLLGGLFVSASVSLIGVLGTTITTVIILLICMIILTGKPLLSLMGRGSVKAYEDVKKHHEKVAHRREEKRALREKQKMLKPSESVIEKVENDEEYDILYPSEKRGDGEVTWENKVKSKTLMDLNPEGFGEASPKSGGFLNSLLNVPPKNVENTIPKGQLYRIYSGEELEQNTSSELDSERADEEPTKTISSTGQEDEFNLRKPVREREDNVTSKKQKVGGSTSPSPGAAYKLPPLSLLARPKKAGSNQDDLIATAQKLEKVLADFGVKVNVTNASSGPSVTRYELQPEQGVKVSRIVGLVDDIKLNLAVPELRIEAPIPGKAAVGIEVPNKESNPVMFRELLESDEFTSNPSKIAFAVGRDIAGNAMIEDIAKMPHLLIAGATGSGKSVCINTLIMSILYKANPDEVKLIMIDPKMVELSVYNGIPHLLYDVVTDPKQASGALNWAVAEMTRRYQLFAEFNVRDIEGYNEKAKKLNLEREMDFLEESEKGSNAILDTLPQIVIIVDELADLMMVAPSEVESSICRLAQLARAAGLHLIVATQRPSVNVITGLIKANMPSRIAFAVASGVDSRTIIDMNGAEKLLGRGDMLFYPSGYPKPVRVQGSFISDEEVRKIVDFVKKQNPKIHPTARKRNVHEKPQNIQEKQPTGLQGNEGPELEQQQEGRTLTHAEERMLAQAQKGQYFEQEIQASHSVDHEQTAQKEVYFDDSKASQAYEIEEYLNGNMISNYPGAPTSVAKEEERDNYFVEAGYLIIEKEKASIGMLQRMFRIGFNRAARIMDQLHESGVVSGEEGTKPRNILMSKEEFGQYIEEQGLDRN